MSVRRQGWTVKWEDNGTTPLADLVKLENGFESVFYNNPGADNTLKSRNLTGLDQFLVLQYYGSTPGYYNDTTQSLDEAQYWSPGTYMNYMVGTTLYFQDLTNKPYLGMPGSAAPFPIKMENNGPGYRPVLGDKTYLPVEIPPGTEWDIILTIVNSMVDPKRPLKCGSSTQYTWTV